MRFGIALPTSGPLTSRTAVEAAVRAADELDYSTVWVGSVQQLVVVSAAAHRVSTALVAATDERWDELGPAATRVLCPRLRYIGGTPHALRAARRAVAGPLLLDTSDTAPWVAAAELEEIDGWSPEVNSPLMLPPLVVPPRWRSAGSPLLFVIRMLGTVTTADLRVALDCQVDEVVVGLPDAGTLDEQLAGFADVAERLAALVQHDDPIRQPAR